MTSVRPQVQIVTDSTADIPPPLAEELGITVIPLQVQIGERTYRDGVDLTGEAFYRLLRAAPGVPVTSQPPLGAIEAVFQALTADGADVVAIHLSAGLSGTYSTAALAARASGLRPGSVTVIDSRTVTMSLGWIVIFAARAARAGASPAEITVLAGSLVPRVRILGLLDTLEWLQRGGRLGRASALVGTMLAIKPILQVQDGLVVPLERVRTKPRARQRLVEITAALRPLEALAVLHADAPDEAAGLATMLASVFPRDQMLLTHIGAALGSHVGPGAVGVACVQAAS